MDFFNLIRSLLETTKKDILQLTIQRRKSGNKNSAVFNPDVFINPDKYARPLAIRRIVADEKFSREGVDFYKQKIMKKEEIQPIIVVKHPRKKLYAVLDGHHRYYAYRELGSKYICSAQAGDYSSVIFYLTEYGYFQPSSLVTENIRKPAKELNKNLKDFIDKFLAN